MEDNAHTIPNRLKLHRRMHGLSQHEVARMLGFHTPAQLSRWEKGTAMPTVRDLFRLGIIYGTLPSALYFEYYQSLKDSVKAIGSRHVLTDNK